MRMLWLGLAVTACLTGCQRGEEQQALGTERRAEEAPAQQQAAPQQPAPAQPQAAPPAVVVGGAVACQPTAEVAQAADRLIAMADVDGDGRVSKVEASGTANFLVGGFFFRADADGDGTVTPEEGRQARAEFMDQHPALAAAMREVRSATGQSPLAVVAQMLDIQYGKPLTMAEARAAARTSVDGLFGWVDQDRDGYLTAAEARATADQGARMLGRAAFQASDTNDDDQLNLGEFQAALQGPSRMAFDMADADKNGQLSEAEAATALGRLAGRLGIQQAARE